MYEVSRVAAIIKPKQPMLDWMKDHSETNVKLTVEQMQQDATTLLIPSFRSPAQANKFIENIYEGIFENELASWGVEMKEWPEERTLDKFNSWFDIEFHSMIFDLGDFENPIE